MGDEHLEIRTLKEKLLFYTTAFFILLGTFSMFAFLFLVPFVIEPAFTTIFMQFEETPALCETFGTEAFYGAKNCSWSSCREGCTKDIYTCTQIRVNYRLNLYNFTNEFNFTEYHINLKEAEREIPPVKRTDRYERALRDYEYDAAGDTVSHLSSNYVDYVHNFQNDNNDSENIFVASVNFMNDDRHPFDQILNLNEGLMENNSNYFYVGARLFPNVKGCGYPPMLNCTIWLKRYTKIGIKYPCYYSKVDPSLVISDLDYWQNTLNLIYSMAIPIPSFIISVIYLTYAYFKIYNEDEDTVPLDKNAEDMDVDEEAGDESGTVLASNVVANHPINVGSISDDNCADGVLFNGCPGMTTSVSQLGIIPTPSQLLIHSSVGSQISTQSDNSFGHQLKVQMADELSRESLDAIPSSPNSIQGNHSKTMTTSISTPPGPTAAV